MKKITKKATKAAMKKPAKKPAKRAKQMHKPDEVTMQACDCGWCAGENEPLIVLHEAVIKALHSATPSETGEIANYLLDIGARTLALATGNDEEQSNVLVPTPATKRLLDAVSLRATQIQQPFDTVIETLIGKLGPVHESQWN